MRELRILCVIGIVCAAAWTVSAGEGASGHGGATHGSPGHGSFAGHMMMPGGCHPEHMGIFFPSEPTHQFMALIAGEPGPGPAYLGMPIGGVVVGGPEHTIAGHPVGPATHPLAHVAARVEAGEAAIPQPTAPGDAESDWAGASTTQPNPPIASPLPSRPPGAAGPGRRMSGWSSPGLPGPGRPPSLQW
jgi:hypothetical protein